MSRRWRAMERGLTAPLGGEAWRGAARRKPRDGAGARPHAKLSRRGCAGAHQRAGVTPHSAMPNSWTSVRALCVAQRMTLGAIQRVGLGHASDAGRASGVTHDARVAGARA
jgi:hypothetical protein